MRGRKRKTALQLAQDGDTAKAGVNKHRERLESIPEARVGLPECPKHLKGLARQAWEFWSGELAYMQQDHRPDAMMLEGACVNYERAVWAHRKEQEQGSTIELWEKADDGRMFCLEMKKHPAVSIREKAWALVRSFCSEFGFSPVSLTKLSVPKRDKPEDDLAKLLFQPRAKRETPLVQ